MKQAGEPKFSGLLRYNLIMSTQKNMEENAACMCGGRQFGINVNAKS
jgi:hypothetical protein